MTEVKIKFPWMTFTCPAHLAINASRVSTTARYDNRMRCWKAPFGAKQLINLKREFPDAEIIEGQKYIDKLKEDLVRLEQGRLMFGQTAEHEIGMEEFHWYKFKLPPFKHQFTGLYYLKAFDAGAMFADCGTGKTAMSLWDIEMKYLQGMLSKSSVLVVGKLMTLFSGWHEDTEVFTNMRSQVLWEKPKSKTEVLDKEVVANHGEKPKGKAKYYEKTEYYFKNSGEEAILSSARDFNEKRHVRKVRKWKQVGDNKYGEETLSTVSITNIRAENIRAKISSREYDVDIINHEGVLFFEEELTSKNYDYIVVDESTVIKSHQGKIFKALCRIAKNTKYKRVLSGTPSPQGPQDLWSQFFFLDTGVTMGTNYKEFLEENFDIIDFGSGATYKGSKPVIRTHGKNGQVGTIEAVNNMLQNRVFRCKLRECVDLPERIDRVLDVYLPDDLQKHYDKMEEELYVELKDRTIEANIDLAKVAKLRQIASGFIIDSQSEKKEVIRLSKSNPKLETLKEWIDEIPKDEKVVIFATYKEEIKTLLRHFGDEAVHIYGETSASGKLDNQRAFVNDPNVRYIICQPSSAAYGVNKLTVARYLCFYSIDYRADTIYQAIKRIERTGQERSMVVLYLIAKGTVDETIFKAVKRKDKVQQKTIDVEIINNFLKRRGG